jgi:hypothetical protein
VGKIIYLRQHYHFGPVKIAMYLERYHDISISHSGVRRVLKRLDLNRLPASQRYKRHDRRWKRYEKPLPGHRVQIDVKFIAPLPGASSRRKHYQFTAIDDCTRLRVLRIYRQLNQKTAIQFANYVLERLPFRVEVIQTDNGAEFQSQFHYHLLDGVVIDDTKVFNDKREWENFYNYHRPHGGLGDQTPTNDSSSTHRPGCKQPPSVAHLVGLVRRASVDPSAYRSAAGLISFRAHCRHRLPAAWRRGCQRAWQSCPAHPPRSRESRRAAMRYRPKRVPPRDRPSRCLSLRHGANPTVTGPTRPPSTRQPSSATPRPLPTPMPGASG